MALMRKCTQCGTVDHRSAWDSPADAAKDGAFNGQWACSSCAWTEFDLSETETEAETEHVDQPRTAATR